MENERRFRVGLGVSGGIAAYKAIELMRILQRSGCDVLVAMTRNATKFVSPLTFRALSGNYVLVDDYEPGNPDPIAHINFSQNIDLLLVVPATANVLAKFANGIADDFLTSTYLASTAPVMVAPAMNTTMWEHPSTQRNLEKLRRDGVEFAEPVAGELACRTVGTGKLEDVENIAFQAMQMLDGDDAPAADSPVREPVENDLLGESILITVGGTREYIDPVRYISNRSSGKMGFALAERAQARGADVTVVAGSTTAPAPEGVRLVRAETAFEMNSAVSLRIKDASIFIGAAAVADYRPKNPSEIKIKKQKTDTLKIELIKNPDILASVAEIRHPRLIVVGFAAETEHLEEYARQKLERKNLDMVVANDITRKGAGFNTDTNIASVFVRGRKEKTDLPMMLKTELADRILDEIAVVRQERPTTGGGR